MTREYWQLNELTIIINNNNNTRVMLLKAALRINVSVHNLMVRRPVAYCFEISNSTTSIHHFGYES